MTYLGGDVKLVRQIESPLPFRSESRLEISQFLQQLSSLQIPLSQRLLAKVHLTACSLDLILCGRKVALDTLHLQLDREAVRRVCITQLAPVILKGAQSVLHGQQIPISLSHSISSSFQFGLQARVDLE